MIISKAVKTALALGFFSVTVQASPKLAPPNFMVSGLSEKAVFVDFQRADYDIVADVATGAAIAKSKITFNSDETGYPIFDLVDMPTRVVLDGKAVAAQEISLPSSAGFQSLVRIVKQVTAPGTHVLEIEHKISKVTFTSGSARGAFFMSDLDDRAYLEQYLPANFEYDQVKMNIHLKIAGAKESHVLFTNGRSAEIANGEWNIEFPEYFTCSSMFFNFGETARYEVLKYDLTLKSGKSVPATIYGKKDSIDSTLLQDFKTAVGTYISEFESLYGPWAHENVVIMATGRDGGGMEYCGATQSGLWALKHELSHSYFARGVMPAQGNAGWIDEAMAIYVAGPYDPGTLSGQSSSLGGHSVYYRETDYGGYSTGSAIFASLAKQSSPEKMKSFLADWFLAGAHTVITSQWLESRLTSSFGAAVAPIFKQYVYGKQDLVQQDVELSAPRVHLTLREALDNY